MSSAMPTAVITLSSENTISNRTICAIVPTRPTFRLMLLVGFDAQMDLPRALEQQKAAAGEKHQVAL
jgi:hypothetical protein